MIKSSGVRGSAFKLHVSGLEQGITGKNNLSWIPHPIGYKIHGGKSEGEIPEDTGLIKANNGLLVSFGTATVKRGFLRIIANPELLLTATVAHPVLVEEKSSQDIFLIIRAIKQTDLSALDWLLKLYVED